MLTYDTELSKKHALAGFYVAGTTGIVVVGGYAIVNSVAFAKAMQVADAAGTVEDLASCAGGSAISCGMVIVPVDKVVKIGEGLFKVATNKQGKVILEEVATKADDVAGNVNDAVRLKTELALQEAGILNRQGKLTQEALAGAEEIPLKGGIQNPTVIDVLTSDGSNISDWGKFTTKGSVELPNGQKVQVHFYVNKKTGEVDYMTCPL